MMTTTTVSLADRLLILVCKLKMLTKWNFEINKFANFLSTLMRSQVAAAVFRFLLQLYPMDRYYMLSWWPTQMSFPIALLAPCVVNFFLKCGKIEKHKRWEFVNENLIHFSTFPTGNNDKNILI